MLVLSARGACRLKHCLVSRRWKHGEWDKTETKTPSTDHYKAYARYMPTSGESGAQFDPSTAAESSLCPLFVPPSLDAALASAKHIRFDRLKEFQGVPTAGAAFNTMYLRRYQLKGSDLVQVSRLVWEEMWSFIPWTPQRTPSVESYLVSFVELYARSRKQRRIVNLTVEHLQEIRNNLLICLAAKARREVFLTHFLRKRVKHANVEEEEEMLEELIEVGDHGLSLGEVTAYAVYLLANGSKRDHIAAAKVIESGLRSHLPAYVVVLRYCTAGIEAEQTLERALANGSLMQTLGMSPEEKEQAANRFTPVHEAYLQTLRRVGGYRTLDFAARWWKMHGETAGYETVMLYLRGLSPLGRGIFLWRKHRDANPSTHVFFDACVRNQVTAKGLVATQWLEKTSHHAFDLPLQHELFPVKNLQRFPCNNLDEFKNYLTRLRARFPAVKRVVVLDDEAAELLANTPEALVKSEEKDSVLFLLTSAVLGNLYVLQKPTLRCLLAMLQEGRFLAEFVHSREEVMCHRTVVELRLIIPVKFPPMYQASREASEFGQWKAEREEAKNKSKYGFYEWRARMPEKTDNETIDRAAVLSALSRAYTTGFIVKEILEPQGVEVRLCAGKRREVGLLKTGMTGTRLEHNERFRMYQYEEVVETDEFVEMSSRHNAKFAQMQKAANTVAERFAKHSVEHEARSKRANEWETAEEVAKEDDTEVMRINRFLADPHADVQEVYGYSNAEAMRFEGEQRRLSRKQEEDDGDGEYTYPTDDELSDDDDDDGDSWYSPVP
eukprot:Rhum_TRINITY_DN4353_c0_g1::Rhum_TRINITY_DN4353_c0_g1_i1::g.13960::m.13960